MLVSLLTSHYYKSLYYKNSYSINEVLSIVGGPSFDFFQRNFRKTLDKLKKEISVTSRPRISIRCQSRLPRKSCWDYYNGLCQRQVLVNKFCGSINKICPSSTTASNGLAFEGNNWVAGLSVSFFAKVGSNTTIRPNLSLPYVSTLLPEHIFCFPFNLPPITKQLALSLGMSVKDPCY